MSVEKAKEFLVDTTESEEVATKIQASYLASLVAISGELGYDLTEDDIVVAIEEMSGLGEDADDTEGFALHDSLAFISSPSFGVITNPLGFGFSRPTRPGGFGWPGTFGR